MLPNWHSFESCFGWLMYNFHQLTEHNLSTLEKKLTVSLPVFKNKYAVLTSITPIPHRLSCLCEVNLGGCAGLFPWIYSV